MPISKSVRSHLHPPLSCLSATALGFHPLRMVTHGDGRGAEAVPRPTLRLAVGGRQRGSDLGEESVQLGADDRDGRDAHHRDKGGKQAVLDHGHAFFCCDETLNGGNELLHFRYSYVRYE